MIEFLLIVDFSQKVVLFEPESNEDQFSAAELVGIFADKCQQADQQCQETLNNKQKAYALRDQNMNLLIVVENAQEKQQGFVFDFLREIEEIVTCDLDKSEEINIAKQKVNKSIIKYNKKNKLQLRSSKDFKKQRVNVLEAVENDNMNTQQIYIRENKELLTSQLADDNTNKKSIITYTQCMILTLIISFVMFGILLWIFMSRVSQQKLNLNFCFKFKMYKTVSSITLLLSLISMSNQLNCPWGNDPVCGVDYITYNNQCALQAAYVEKLHNGKCEKIMVEGELVMDCEQTYLPVCGKDSVTYLNQCTLKANDMKLAYNGPCDNKNYKPHNPPLVCRCKHEDFAPVCSLGGYTYENKCVLNCTQQIHQSVGPCSTPCDCDKKYRPVCGVDGYTYDNECALDCVGAVKQGRGECPALLKGCQYCSAVFMPTCGENGVTYRNLCELKCNKTKFLAFGKCKKEHKPQQGNCDICPQVHDPICGTDGLNYKNECLCRCKGNCQKYSSGKCPVEKTCARCAGVLEPVCGESGVTYDNLCYLECAQDTLYDKGYCEDKQKKRDHIISGEGNTFDFSQLAEYYQHKNGN